MQANLQAADLREVLHSMFPLVPLVPRVPLVPLESAVPLVTLLLGVGY